MTDWQIDIPLGPDRDLLDLAAVADAAHAELDPERAAVAIELALGFIGECDTYGDLRARLEHATQAERCALLDRARRDAGLPTTGRVEAEREFNARLAAPTSRDMHGRVEHRCHEVGCTVIEPNERLGPGSVAWSKINGPWYCQRHRAGHEQAFEPYEPRGLTLNPRTGLLVDLDAQERERERAEREAAARQKSHERREAERCHDATQLAKLEAARNERWRQESIVAELRP